MGRLTCTDDSEGNTVSYTYDEAGNVSGITYPDGGVISYKYDKNNNLISVKDATGKETRYSYDALDRVTLTERPNNINTRIMSRTTRITHLHHWGIQILFR